MQFMEQTAHRHIVLLFIQGLFSVPERFKATKGFESVTIVIECNISSREKWPGSITYEDYDSLAVYLKLLLTNLFISIARARFYFFAYTFWELNDTLNDKL